MQAVVCDTKGDANGEVDCARKMVDEGVVATSTTSRTTTRPGLGRAAERRDPACRQRHDRYRDRRQPDLPVVHRDRWRLPGRCSRIQGPRQDEGRARADRRSHGGGFKGFISPPFKAAGVDVVGDVAIATGSTDYAPYVADIQRSDPDAVLLAIDDTSAAQLIAAMEQLNYKVLLGGHPGTFPLDVLRKFKGNTKGALLAESFPYPSQNNVKNFPGLKQFFADMKASGKAILDPKEIQPTSLYPWISTLGFVNATKGVDSFTKETVVQALKTAKDVDLLGLAPPWTPSTPGFSFFGSVSNHFVYVSRFDGKNVVTEKGPIDVTQYFK